MYNEKTKKETVTNESILQDVKPHFSVGRLLFIYFLCYLTILLFLAFLKIFYFKGTIAYIALGAFTAFVIYHFIQSRINAAKIKRGQFLIVTEKLTGKRERYKMGRNFNLMHPVDYFLTFNSGKEFQIFNMDNYKWSKNFCMPEKSFFRSSNVGDEFYIITLNGVKPLCVYNKKFFELNEK